MTKRISKTVTIDGATYPVPAWVTTVAKGPLGVWFGYEKEPRFDKRIGLYRYVDGDFVAICSSSNVDSDSTLIKV